jgi:hypothetical protein
MAPEADPEAAGRGAEAGGAGACAGADNMTRSGKPAVLRRVLQELVAMGLRRLAGLTCVVELAPGGSQRGVSSALRLSGAEAREARAEAACHYSEVSEDKESLED